MSYMVLYGDGKKTCGHHHHDIEQAKICMERCHRIAQKVKVQGWATARVISKETKEYVKFPKIKEIA